MKVTIYRKDGSKVKDISKVRPPKELQLKIIKSLKRCA